jgi:hypothetical protein
MRYDDPRLVWTSRPPPREGEKASVTGGVTTCVGGFFFATVPNSVCLLLAVVG